MMYSFGIIMDPIQNIDINKDSTIAIIEALQKNSKVFYITPGTIHINNKKVYGELGRLKINKKKAKFFEILSPCMKELTTLDCILFRLDPPVDEHYIHLTYILDHLELQGVLIINSPQSLRDFNEKILGNILSNKQIPTIITSNKNHVVDFLKKHKKIVLKPMNLMAGKGIISLSFNDKDNDDLIDKVFDESKHYVICQKFIKEIINGDTRILITNGVIHEDVLVRYPPKNDFRSNLSYGGNYEVNKINKKYLGYLKEVAEYLKYNRIYFAGVDMIGDYITEINITSPTGIKQIEEKNKKISNEIASEFIKIIHNYYDEKK
jgi:glutathione synthase